ncbi:hypothetical protein GGS26DRAFT_444003 [Hypomontagnella submonticulosa]|nr:hypothetical protein GGS26DRAFT_444003 [Hypomontagnella submonticulosa]
MANVKQKVKRQASSLRRSIIGILQGVFAITLFAIFVIAWLVQGGTIALPQWAKAWNGVSPELQATYAAALIPAICVLAVLFIGSGVILMIRDQRVGRNNSAV